MVPSPRPDLDESHAALDKPPRNQQLIALGRAAIKFARCLRLFVQVKRIRRFGLHFECHLIGLQPRFKLRLFLQILAVQLIELMDQIQLPALLGQRRVRIANVFDQLVHGSDLCVDADALINSRQKCRLPVRAAAGWGAAGPQRNVAGHILIFAAQSIEQPRANAWPGKPGRTGVHKHRRDFVRGDVSVHRANHRQVIHHLAQFRKHFAYFYPRLAVLRKFEWGRHRDSI